MTITYLSGERIQGSLTGGKVGTGSGNFDGNDNLNFTGNGDMDGDFTIAFWFHRKQASAAGMTVYDQSNSANSGTHRIQIGTQGPGSWAIYGTGLTVEGGTPAIDTWYHLALTGSGTTWKWYENGVLIDTTTSNTNATRTNDGTVRIMAEATVYTEGYMDEFCQYDRALSLAEVLSLADGSKKPNDATLDTSNSLVLYLPMDTTASSGLTNWYDDKSSTGQAISTTGNPALITDATIDDKATITNVPTGTRFEETDTKKIFRRTSGGAWVANR